ncbi:MAG: MlaE family lipid ABC transporter permease subunit [Bacteroidales bacterium]|nr:MlaE family lipid ABC transporter permease subunit [Bacteroidales bacterium]
MPASKTETQLHVINNNGIEYRMVGNTFFLYKSLTVEEAAGFATKMLKLVKPMKLKTVILDISDLDNIDSAGVMSLFYVKKKLAEQNTQVDFTGGSELVNSKIKLFYPETHEKISLPPKTSFFERVGQGVYEFFSSYVFGFLLLMSNVFYWAFHDLFRPRARRKGEFVNQAVLIGVNAALIVVFLSFVIGYVLALQASGQLRSFGANIFIVDLVVYSIMAQMGPLITAILVAGRSASAIAAEIGTMKVTAELDALKTMALNPNRFVVVPKLYACMLTMPFLIVLANISGITGGALAAWWYLDIGPEIFTNRMASIMLTKDLYTALVKSQVYAAIIVLTGSFYGFRVDRGAEGVGRATTIAVVVAITLVILADSILGVMFYT